MVIPLPAAGPDPVVAALLRGDICWGDIDIDGTLLPPLKPAFASTSGANDFWDALQDATSALWSQPFAANLEAHAQDAYDTTDLTDAEFATMMTWLCANGWEITGATRTGVMAVFADLPPTQWVSLEALYALKEAGACDCGSHPAVRKAAVPAPALAAAGTDGGRRKGAPIPRFCKAAGGCQEEGCRYVHGNTISKVNKPCGFGAGCGAADPTGVKRSTCLFLHPGETWTEGLCIHRPKEDGK
jgi:hypothetical protein